MNKYNKVVTYEFGVNLIPDMIQMMDKLGYTSKIISRGDNQGLVYFRNRLSSRERTGQSNCLVRYERN